MTTNNPMVLAAFHVLQRIAPSSLPFSDLLQRMNDRLSVNEPPGIPAPADRAAPLSSLLLQCAIGGVVAEVAQPAHLTVVLIGRPP